MADESALRLHNVSVVVTAEHHNPSILHPAFLESHGIVPENWQVAETFTTPPMSVVKYTNGVAWTMDPLRLTVTEHCGPAFGEHYECHGLVTEYLERLPHVPYRELGLNCQVSVLRDEPGRWLVNRFAAAWLRGDPQVLGMKPALALNAGDVVCNVSFQEGELDDGACVGAECNVHHPGPLDVKGLHSAIARWPERQRFIEAALGRLLKERTDDAHL